MYTYERVVWCNVAKCLIKKTLSKVGTFLAEIRNILNPCPADFITITINSLQSPVRKMKLFEASRYDIIQ